MSYYLREISKHTSTIRNAAYDILELSRAFGVTGNHKLESDLYDLHKNLLCAQEGVSGAVSKEISDELMASQNSAAETVVACLNASLA